MDVDGLNSLVYQRVSMEMLPTHTHIVVDFDRTKIEETVYAKLKSRSAQ